MPLSDLKQNQMMRHLIASLESGQDIGHYGRLTFAMVARPFLEPEEIVALLAKGADCGEDKARALVAQVEQRGYNPPKRERILEWMQKQEFPICPDSENPQSCNVYRDLEFPREVYDRISSLYTEGRNAT